MAREIRTADDVAADLARLGARYGGRVAVAGGGRGTAEAATEAEGVAPKDASVERLLKYIPAEVIAVYLPVQAQLLSMDQTHARLKWGILWALFLALIPGTVVYLRKYQDVTKGLQLAISAAAFVVWVIGTGGGPFQMLVSGEVLSQFGPLLIPIFTFGALLAEPKKAAAPTQ